MVYAMNLGLPVEAESGNRAVLSHMRYPERRMETETAEAWFGDHGYAPVLVGREGIGAHVEAGDAFAWRGDLVVGYGPRTEELALKHLATELGVRVRGVRITHPACTTSTSASARSTRARDGLPGRLRRRVGAPRC